MQTELTSALAHPSARPTPQINPSMLSVRGHSNRCDMIIGGRTHALVGISPFNSRFCPNYVAALLAWARSNFEKTDVLIPDTESAAILLISTGMPTQKAIRKARKELNRQRRTIEKAALTSASNLRIIEFSDYFENEYYIKTRKIAQEEYENNHEFRAACATMSRSAIENRLQSSASDHRKPPASSIRVANNYILTEIPFYLDTPKILNVTSSTLIYHRKWPIGDQLIDGQFRMKISENQAHGIVSISPPTGTHAATTTNDK